MPKVLLTRHQFVNHVYYHAGENEVTDEVAAVLKKRGVLGELPTAAKKAVAKPSAKPTNKDVINNGSNN